MSFNLHIFSRAKAAWEYRSEPEEMHFLAALYWRLIQLFVVCIACLALVLGFSEFASTTQTSDQAVVGSAGTPSLNRAVLQSTLDEFSARQSLYQSLSAQGPAPIVDPSQ